MVSYKSTVGIMWVAASAIVGVIVLTCLLVVLSSGAGACGYDKCHSTTTHKPTTTVRPTTTVKPPTTVRPTTTVKPTTTVAPSTVPSTTTCPYECESMGEDTTVPPTISATSIPERVSDHGAPLKFTG